jgi:hypothetical protein
MVRLAVFAVSFTTLAFEVILVRLFSFSQWHHLSFMVISIALFGFAASGSILSLVDPSRWIGPAGRFDPARVALPSLLCSASIFIAFLGMIRLPLDYFRMVLEPIQLLYLLGLYLLLILPFFFAGWVIALAYMAYPQQPGLVYFASMMGSALGAIAVAALLAAIGEVAMVALIALAPAAVLPFGIAELKKRTVSGRTLGRSAPAVALGWVLVGTAGIWLLTPAAQSRLNIKSSEYKMLSQVLQFPDTQVVESISGIRGRIERVRSPHLRFAPGLSLKYTDPLPAAEAVFVDRDQPLFLYEPSFSEGFDFARFTHSFVGYQIVGTPDRILLIMGTGGLALACARASGAQQVRIVQPDPNLANMIRQHDGRLEVVTETPRAVLARSGETFDLIHIENWGSSLPGADALHQDHLLTVDGLQECLRRLTPQGALVVSRKLLLPPSISLRLWATMREALVRFGQVEPERCMAMLRNWDTFTLVAMPRPLDDPQRVLEFARRLNFDIVYLSGAAEFDPNRFNVFDEPYHYREIRELEKAVRAGTAEGFLSEYLLDVEPRTDLQPFPGRFLKWNRIGDLYRSLGGRLQAIFLAGEVVVAVVFVQAVAVAGVLLLVPAALISKKSRMTPPSSIVFFLGIGAGFLFAEMLFIYTATFFIGDPVTSLAVVLATLLVSSGAGGLWAQRRGRLWIRRALLAAVAAMVWVGMLLWIFAGRLLALPEFWRYAMFAVSMMIPGFAMGMPFPLGMRFLLHLPEDRAFAWAANGCASILASIAAAQIAISWGLHWILGATIICYALAYWGSRVNEERDAG